MMCCVLCGQAAGDDVLCSVCGQAAGDVMCCVLCVGRLLEMM